MAYSPEITRRWVPFLATVEHDPDLSLLLTSCLRFGHRRWSLEWDFIFHIRSMSLFNSNIFLGDWWSFLGRACVGMRFAGFGWSGASEIVIRKHFFFPLRWLPPHPSSDMIFFSAWSSLACVRVSAHGTWRSQTYVFFSRRTTPRFSYWSFC